MPAACRNCALLFTLIAQAVAAQAPLQDARPAAKVVSADPQESDPAKRRVFVSELNRRRVNFGCFQHSDKLSEDNGLIPQAEKQEFLEACRKLLPDVGPHRAKSVRWYAAIGNPSTEKQFLVLVVAEWRVDSYVLQASRAPGSDYIRVLVSIPHNQRLDVIALGSKDEGNQDRAMTMPDGMERFVDKLIGGRANSPAYVIRSHQTHEVDGVTVYLSYMEIPASQELPARSESAGRLHRILVVNSDPQYICLGFSLGD